MMAKANCVYLFCLYAPGHLFPMVEAAKRLLQLQCNSSSISIHILLTQPKDPSAASPLCHSYIQSLQLQNHNPNIHFHPLPSIDLPSPTHFDSIEEFVTICVRLYLPHVRAALSASPSPVSAIIVDMFASDVIDVAKELHIPTYIYFTSTATFLNLLLHLSVSSTQLKYDDQVDFLEVDEAICVPGLTPIPPIFMPVCLQHTNSTAYKSIIYQASRYKEAKAIIINSNLHIEGKAIEALVNAAVTDQLTPGSTFPDIYPIGPIINFGETSTVQEHKCLEWLDKQPEKSVVYLCFGSTGAFEVSQVRQIAAGLEESGHHFLWVLRMPRRGLLSGPSDPNLEEILPEGFLERTKGKGMVWPSYAPQTEILSHQAIGGFVTLGGWNSILESLWFGVPMVPWPLHAEQHLNAFLLVNEMHVAIALDFDRKNKGFVTATEFERAVKQLMDASSEEGRRARERAAAIMSACRNAVAVQTQGVSCVHLQKLARELGLASSIN